MGYGLKLLNHIIIEAKKNGVDKISIETGAGNFFKPARKLFESAGFKKCKPFAHYKEDQNSCYYSKEI